MKILHVFAFLGVANFFDGQFKYLKDNGIQNFIASNDAEGNELCRSNNVGYFHFPIVRDMNPIADLKSIWELSKIIRKEKFDIVVGHTPKGAMVSMIASFVAGSGVRVYFRHGLVYTTAHGIKRTILKSVERATALFSTNIVNVSPSLSKLAVKDRLNSDRKQHVIGKGTCGGINTKTLFNPSLIEEKDKFELRAQLGIEEAEFVVGFCGRLVNDKGIRELTQGYRIFTKKHPEIKSKLLLVGRFDTRDALPEGVKSEILNSDDIISTGYIRKPTLATYYSIMDVMVLPSYREGFGMSVIEASAMEVPILVSRSHGCIDSIEEHITGEYIDIKPESIAYGIEKMLNADFRRRLGRNGREFAAKNFERTNLWPLYLDFYQSLEQ